MDTADANAAPGWKVLIVDGSPEARGAWQDALAKLHFDDRPLRLLSASGPASALEVLRAHPDVVVLLLDAGPADTLPGLPLVAAVRDGLGNHGVRIVLYGEAELPAQALVERADINDFRDRATLDRPRMAATVLLALRAWRERAGIEASRNRLERVLDASAEVSARDDGQSFAAAVLQQLPRLAPSAGCTLLCRVRHDSDAPYHYPVIMATGSFAGSEGRDASGLLPLPRMESLHRALRKRRHQFRDDHCVLHFIDAEERESLLFLVDTPARVEADRTLMQVFSANVSVAYRNLHLSHDLVDSQLEMVWRLAGAAETRSRETANHVLRVGLLSELLGRAYGLDRKAAEALRLAAPLHDIGKIGIPDTILNKPGPHTPEEAAIMRSHARLGAQLLSGSKWPLLQLASQICLEHHENWDGSGYPLGLSGEDISLEGRIVALADVFDALGNARSYKDPWSLVKIRAYVSDQSGRKFDPRLVTLLFEHWDEAESLRERYPDQ